MEKTIVDLREKSALLNAYAELLEELKRKEKWYQHKKVTHIPETGEEVELEEWEDDDGEYSAANLKAIRSIAVMIRKAAGI